MGFQNFVQTVLKQLEQIIWRMNRKKREIFVNWLKRHNYYLSNEESFDPKDRIVYKRGMVIHVDFGFRVGAEYGGYHWAVVIQNDNKKAHTVVVVPLSSIKEGHKVHPLDADLGTIDGLNEIRSEALLGQITTISKMRIKKGKPYRLSDEQLDKIDAKIIDRYTGPNIKSKFREKTKKNKENDNKDIKKATIDLKAQ